MNKPRYVIQWDAQPIHFCRTMCSLLESQILVDITIISNSYSLKVHKCVMAANSPYFREQLQKEPSVDKVVINGVKHTVLKAIIEFIYCGETSIYEDSIHEFIAVANYFELRGLKAILPHKIGITCNDYKELLLQIKPPIFFCKNEKVRSVRHSVYVPDLLYGEEDVKVVLDGNNYQVFENTKRRTQPTSVVDEAHVALAKEEAASRFALQMLQKDLNVTSNLFIIEDTCTEATVETSLTTQFEDSASIPSEDTNIVQNDISNTSNIPEEYKLQNMDNKLEKEEKVETEHDKDSKSSEKIKECFQILHNDISTDFPILYKSTDGSYINVTNEMFKNLAQSGAIHYQVVQEDGHIGDFQHYICNDFNDINVNTNEEINKDCQMRKQNEPMTLKQLVAETITPDYVPSDKNYLENMNSNLSSMVVGLSSEEHIEEIPHQSNEHIETDTSFNNYILNDKEPVNFEQESNPFVHKSMCAGQSTEATTTIHENIIINENIADPVMTTPLKRKRGRPRKIKLDNEMKELPTKIYENKMLKDKNFKLLEEMPQNISLISPNQFKDKNESFYDDQKVLKPKKNYDNDFNVMSNRDEHALKNNDNDDIIIVQENSKHDENVDKSEEMKNNPILNLISLNKDIPFAVGLLPLHKTDKNLKSPKSKRRCTRSSNKDSNDENQE